MKWNYAKEKKPKDDQNVLVLNDKFDDLISHKAYYDKAYDCFFSLESSHAFPLEVTHWILLPIKSD